MIPKIPLSKLTPKSIFLIDAIGALLTATSLITVCKYFEVYIGMPSDVLNILSGIAFAFCTYSFACHFLVKNNLLRWLIVIGIANLGYCCLTAGLMYFHFSSLTQLGIAYFSGEISIIGILIYFEFQFSKKNSPLD
jgi:hypothetical protein